MNQFTVAVRRPNMSATHASFMPDRSCKRPGGPWTARPVARGDGTAACPIFDFIAHEIMPRSPALEVAYQSSPTALPALLPMRQTALPFLLALRPTALPLFLPTRPAALPYLLPTRPTALPLFLAALPTFLPYLLRYSAFPDCVLKGFVARATRLYEQEPEEACASARLGLYVRRWSRPEKVRSAPKVVIGSH